MATQQVEGYRDFASVRDEVVTELRELATLNRGLGMEDGAAQLEELADRVQAGVFRVLVLGEFKRGKSTLINRLLGMEALPVGAAPTTAVLTHVRYGAEPAARLILEDGTVRTIAPAKLAEEITLSQRDEAANERRHAGIARAEVLLPAPLCRDGV